MGALATVPENVSSDDEMMRLAITMGTMMGLLMLFAGLGMGKHLKTVGNSSASASETSAAPESSPEPEETPAESTQSDDEAEAATE